MFEKAHILTIKKFLILMAMSVPVTAILEFFEKYVYNDWDFLVSLIILIGIDTVLGIVKSWRDKSISSSGFSAVIMKVALYFTALVTVHVLTTYTISGTHPVILDYIDDFLMTALMVRETISIFENIAVLNPNIIPKYILKKLKDFDSETGEKLDSNGNKPQQQ